MTKNVGSHYGVQSVRCNVIAPAQVDTGMTHSIDGYDMFGLQQSTRGVKGLMNRAAQPEEIANIALFLASDESPYINEVVLAADASWSAH